MVFNTVAQIAVPVVAFGCRVVAVLVFGGPVAAPHQQAYQSTTQPRSYKIDRSQEVEYKFTNGPYDRPPLVAGCGTAVQPVVQSQEQLSQESPQESPQESSVIPNSFQMHRSHDLDPEEGDGDGSMSEEKDEDDNGMSPKNTMTPEMKLLSEMFIKTVVISTAENNAFALNAATEETSSVEGNVGAEVALSTSGSSISNTDSAVSSGLDDTLATSIASSATDFFSKSIVKVSKASVEVQKVEVEGKVFTFDIIPHHHAKSCGFHFFSRRYDANVEAPKHCRDSFCSAFYKKPKYITTLDSGFINDESVYQKIHFEERGISYL